MVAKCLAGGIVVAAAMVASVGPGALAADVPVFNAQGISLSASAGIMTGMAHELVYNEDGSMLSRLDWMAKADPTFGLAANYKMSSQISLFGSATIGLDGSNHDDDYDWQVDPPPAPFSDHSWTDSTRLDHYLSVDGGLRYTFAHRETGAYSMLVGGRYTDVQFTDIGGCFWYDSGADTGCFPSNEAGISYRQMLPAVYVGFGWAHEDEKWSASLDALGGMSMRPWDQDHHWSRDLLFNDFGASQPYLGLRAKVGYAMSARSNFFLKADYDNYLEAKGPMDIFNISDGAFQERVSGTPAGLSWESLNVALGVATTF